VEYVARMGAYETIHRILVESAEWRKQFENRKNVRMWIGFIWRRIETSGGIFWTVIIIMVPCKESYLEQSCDCQLLKDPVWRFSYLFTQSRVLYNLDLLLHKSALHVQLHKIPVGYCHSGTYLATLKTARSRDWKEWKAHIKE
jgi:hypothetical protein